MQTNRNQTYTKYHKFIFFLFSSMDSILSDKWFLRITDL